MLNHIYLENERIHVHSFRAEDLSRFEQLSKDIFDILSDEKTLKYIPEKRIYNLQEAESFLQTNIINYHSGRNYLHFIHHKQLDKVIGIIDLISPNVAKDHYCMDEYPFFIEFYLSGFASGCYIMTEILPLLIEDLHKQGILSIGAVINRNNIAARKVLENANFEYKAPFDIIQDFYQTTV